MRISLNLNDEDTLKDHYGIIFSLLCLVLVNEGESCRVIGFISEGTCNLKRCVDVAKVNRDGTKVNDYYKMFFLRKLTLYFNSTTHKYTV